MWNGGQSARCSRIPHSLSRYFFKNIRLQRAAIRLPRRRTATPSGPSGARVSPAPVHAASGQSGVWRFTEDDAMTVISTPSAMTYFPASELGVTTDPDRITAAAQAVFEQAAAERGIDPASAGLQDISGLITDLGPVVDTTFMSQ